jgi:hypothetical protein
MGGVKERKVEAMDGVSGKPSADATGPGRFGVIGALATWLVDVLGEYPSVSPRSRDSSVGSEVAGRISSCGVSIPELGSLPVETRADRCVGMEVLEVLGVRRFPNVDSLLIPFLSFA